jgi:hypothetical protein
MSPAALMAGGGERCVLGRAREERKGKLYRRVEVVPPHHRGLQEFQHGRGAAATCGGADDQWGMAVRPPASAPRPRGTGLGLHASVTASSAQCHQRRPRTAGFSGASACACEPGTARPTWRRASASCAGAPAFKHQFRLAPFQTEFSPKIQIEVLQTLNTKVIEQVTLFKNAKGSIGFCSLV